MTHPPLYVNRDNCGYYTVAEVHGENADMTLVTLNIVLSTLLTSQLSSDSLERQLSELLDKRPELGAADQLMFTIVQLIDGDQTIRQNSLY